ncbi:hypothetical protein BJX66DRAFT_345991 [Aspergillus keveii]|uniref:Ankyrin repeat protein n=1 Tax=Aspergillus keveii TaxID=714993 RepID=A0ABR4FGD5_9EURO
MPGKSSNQKLREACRSRANTSIESLRALLEENPKPNINFEFSNGDLPLRCALEAGKEDWAVELLQHGAEIPKNDGVPDQALLRLAADRGFAKAVALLLEKGAAVDYPGKRLAKCHTPLHAAALKGHTKDY